MAKNNVTVDETVEEVKELKTPEGNPVDVTEKEGFGKKLWNGCKKHGKKIAIVAGTAAVGIIGYALGSKKKNSNQVPGLEIIDMDSVQDEVFDTDIASDIDANE